jgi:glycosyltransferase involved in cell wall biosynthesis
VSSFVKNSFENSNIKVPITNIGQGIDQIDSKELSVIKSKGDKITFLHISSGLPRKGVNDLIDSFISAFKDRTDVELILKTYPNPQNTINEYLKKYGNQTSIKHICKDLSQEEIEELYRKADVYVSPSRGEGFNRPVAEAMIRNIPVIVTGWSGHMDFCNEDNSLLVKYNIEDSTSHLSGDSSSWAVIDKEDLKNKLLQVFDEIKTSSNVLGNRVNIAREALPRMFCRRM